MQTKKMSLANIQGKLSRTEMKNIMAGSAGTFCHNTNNWCSYVGGACNLTGSGYCVSCGPGKFGCAHG